MNKDESTRENPSPGDHETGADREARQRREAYESAKRAESEARRALAEASRALKEAAEQAGIAAREIGREVSAGAEEAFEDLAGAARIAGERARDATAEALGWAKSRVEATRTGAPAGPAEAPPRVSEVRPEGEVRPGGSARDPRASAVDANLSAALAYIGWALTGILFYLLGPRDRFVRFHALQSILHTAAFVVVGVALSVVPFIGPLLFALASLGFVFVWLLVMWKALRYEEYRLPFIGEIARTQIDRRS